MEPYALGRLCVEKGLLSEQQLEHLLDKQKNAREWRHLGQILLEAGVVTATTMASLLSIQKQRRDKEQGVTEEAAVPASALAWLLEEAENAGAEVLVISPGHPPAFRDRASGTRFVDGPALGPAQMQRILGEALTQEHLFEVEREGAVHATVDLEGRRGVSMLLYRCQKGVAASLRLAAADPDVRALELPAPLSDLLRHRAGLVVVTGSPGNGRDAALEALLAALHGSRACHLLLLQRGHTLAPEGPGRSRITVREVGRDTRSFAAGLRAAPAMDVDVACAPDLENAEDIAAALDVAHTGRLVVAGMRTRGAVATIECILGAFARRRVPFACEALATCLRGIAGPQLLPARDGCPPAVAAEILLNTPQVAGLIRGGHCSRIAGLLKDGADATLVSMEESLAGLYRKGRIRAGDAMKLALDREALRRILEQTPEAPRVER